MAQFDPNKVKEIGKTTEEAFGQAASKAKPRVSLMERIGGFFSALMFPLMAISEIGMASRWIGDRKLVQKAPKVSGTFKRMGEVAGLSDLQVGEIPGAVSQMFGSNHAAAKTFNAVGNVTAKTANRVLGGKAAQRMSEATGSTALWAGSAVVGQGIETVYSIKDRRSTYKSIQTALAASGLSPQAVEASGILKMAKNEVGGARAWLGVGAKVAGMAGNVYLMMFSRMSGRFAPMLTYAGLAAATTGADALIRSGHNLLPTYSALTKSMERNGNATLEQYMDVVGSLNPNVPYDALQKFAQQSAKEQISGAELLRRTVIFRQELAKAPKAAPAAKAPATPEKTVSAAGVAATGVKDLEKGWAETIRGQRAAANDPAVVQQRA